MIECHHRDPHPLSLADYKRCVLPEARKQEGVYLSHRVPEILLRRPGDERHPISKVELRRESM